MNISKKALLLGLLIPGMMGAAQPAAPTSARIEQIKQAAELLKTAPQLWDIVKSIPGVGNQSWAMDVERYAIKPAASLGNLLARAEVYQANLQAASEKIKQLPTIARCGRLDVKKQNATIQNACKSVGCSDRNSCMRIGFDNIVVVLELIELVLFSTNQGILPPLLDIAQQSSLKQVIHDNAAEPLQKAISLLKQLSALLPKAPTTAK